MDKAPTLVELVAAGIRIPSVATIRCDMPRLGRNKKCFCGSGKKYKKCCLLLERAISQLEREQDAEEEMEVKDED